MFRVLGFRNWPVSSLFVAACSLTLSCIPSLRDVLDERAALTFSCAKECRVLERCRATPQKYVYQS